MARGRLLIGTSGWMYRHWAHFYPRRLPSRRQLEWISRVFPTVEINASFYMLPTAESFTRWAEQTPDGFVFAVKASRFLTHMKRLIDPAPAAEKLLAVARQLGDKLGPILLQLPPQFQARPDRLAEALAAFHDVGAGLGLSPQIAVEFRHASWFESRETLAVLRRHRAALVHTHSVRWPATPPDVLTAPWVYLRFHGPGPTPYGVSRLRSWAQRIHRWRAEGRTVYAYFNNDGGGHALRDARSLMRLCGEAPAKPDATLFPPTVPPRRRPVRGPAE